ncbi:MAG: ATP-binding protein [Alphaproteobacteria bacterium]|nr:ATP-binding protein [Alphaproteobacteria bacterium]
MAAIAVLVTVNAFALLRQSDYDERLRGVNETLSDLRYVDELASEILQSPNQRTAKQWNRLLDRLDDRLDQLFMQLDISEGFQNEIRGRLSAIDRAVQRLNDTQTSLSPAAKKALVGRLSSNRNALFTQIERLQSELGDRRSALIETTGLIVAVSIFFVAVIVIVSAVILRRTVLVAVDEIGGAVEKLKPGHSDPIETDRSDEIGDMLRRMEDARKILTRAFEREARSRQAAEDLSRAKTSFIATTSHELRTPLNGLLGSLSFLAQSDLTPDQARYARMAQSSGDALLAVINDVLDFSRIESGGIQLEDIAFLPTQVLSDFASMYSMLAEQKNLEYSVTIDLEDDLALHGDPERIRQILNNLIGNALKFTDSGSVRVQACLDKARLGATKNLIIEVSDTGIGIPEDKVKAIFEPFAQADGSTSRRFGGSGLGLSISAKLAQAMGGNLTVTSQPGVGSTFRLTLPLRKAKVEDVLSMAHVMSGTDLDSASLNGLQVLVVDDVEINRVIASDMLSKWGCLVSEAYDGRKALEALERYTFDVVLMDVQMPEMDGLTATRKAREFGHELPIIGMTANAFKEQRDEYLAGGMNEVVSKPVDWAKLKTRLLQLCPERPNPKMPGKDTDPRQVAPEHVPPSPPFHDSASPLADSLSAPSSGITVSAPAVASPQNDLDEPVLDIATIGSLKGIMPAEKLEDLGLRAIDQVYESIETLRAPHSAEERSKIAHTVKGMCANLGFTTLTRVCKELEFESNEDRVSDLVRRLDSAAAETRREFTALTA